jgi:hypothetical protein
MYIQVNKAILSIIIIYKKSVSVYSMDRVTRMDNVMHSTNERSTDNTEQHHRSNKYRTYIDFLIYIRQVFKIP